MRNKKKIGRIAKGEVVVAEMMPEELIDMFDKMTDLKDEMLRAREEHLENPSFESARKYGLLKVKAEMARINFWEIVNERYALWEKDCGIRDGYSVVTMSEDSDKSSSELIKRVLGDMFGSKGE